MHAVIPEAGIWSTFMPLLVRQGPGAYEYEIPGVCVDGSTENWCSFSAATSVSTCMQRDTTYVKGYMAWQNQLLFNQLQSMFSDEIPGPLNPVNVLAPGLLLASNAMGNIGLKGLQWSYYATLILGLLHFRSITCMWV